MKKIVNVLLLCAAVWTSAYGQQPEAEGPSSVDIKQLPEYVVITSENTKLIGGIDITIDYKKSDYEPALTELETLLQNRKKLRIRNQTDLLNAMLKLGFEYVDAYNATAGTLGVGAGEDVAFMGSDSKYRINMIFRKKEKYRDER